MSKMIVPYYQFDVAISFSGSDRRIARSIAKALNKKDITVFYDEWAQHQLWERT